MQRHAMTRRDPPRDAVAATLLEICGKCGEDVFLRRWGSRDHFKAYKLIALIKRVDWPAYARLFDAFSCKFGDDMCLYRALMNYLRRRLKSFESIYTLRDLCDALRNGYIY